MITPLSKLLTTSHADDTLVAWTGNRSLSWQDCVRTISYLAQQLSQRQEKRWIVWCENSFAFICVFFALLHTRKEVIIPPNFQEGTLEILAAQIDAVVTDHVINTVFPQLTFDLSTMPSSSDYRFENLEPTTTVIDLFTSGSSGMPKRVRKHLGLFEAEIHSLEQSWGKYLNHTFVLATVPHHHIYGLLFRLLWPLATLKSGRSFSSETCSNPNELFQQLQPKSVLVSSPAHLNRLGDLMDLALLKPQCEIIFSSGGPLSPAAAQVYRHHLGFAPIEIYGSTETGGIAWRQQQTDSDTWQPLPQVELVINEGILNVRSPFIEEKNWFETNDGAQWVGDQKPNCFYLKGRLDSIAKIEEKRVSLIEIAQRLKQHPFVADAGVIVIEGEYRKFLGAAIGLSPQGSDYLKREGKQKLSQALRRHLAHYYDSVLLPRYWRFPESLPYNERGKLTVAALTELFTSANNDKQTYIEPEMSI